MGSEYELKYRADEACLKSVFTTFPARWQTITMETTYFDTPSGSLSARKYMLRTRLENGVSICTLKTPAAGGGRGEWETEGEEILSAIPELCRLGAPEQLPVLVAGGVEPVCGARFTRMVRLVEAPDCTVELALDQGILLGSGRETDLCEVEVELKSGSEAAAAVFAEALAARFSLTGEPRSKYRRALALANQKP